MEIAKALRLVLVFAFCLGLSLEQMHHPGDNTRPARKSRRKRRGCKCVQKYHADVNRLIDSKLEEFLEQYEMTKKNETSVSTMRLQNGLVRLSSDVSEAKNALRLLSNDMQTFSDTLESQKKLHTKFSTRVRHMADDLTNLTTYVNTMEQRLAYRVTDIAANDNGHPTSSENDNEMPTQCQEEFEKGKMKYKGDYYVMIKPAGVTHAFKALCRMENSSGWTVVQKRQDGSVDFYRTWEEYRRGFGSLEGEFWLGNDNIHYLTSQEDTMLRIDMEDWNGRKHFAIYDHFKVGGPEQRYVLQISGYHGNAGDSLTSLWDNHNGMKFSTKDEDHDGRFYDSCAQHYQGAWWFNNCFESHLNGRYYHKGFHKNYFQRDGIQWNTIHMYSSLKAVRMMIKPGERLAKPTPTTTTTTSNEVV